MHDRLESVLQFSKTYLRKYFTTFMKHTAKLVEAFQLLDIGQNTGKKKSKHRDGQIRGSGRDKSPSQSGSESGLQSDGKSGRFSSKKKSSLPKCPYALCTESGKGHLIKDFLKASAEEMSKMFEELKASKYRDGPAKSTRGQQGSCRTGSESSRSDAKLGGTLGRTVTKPPTDPAEAQAPSSRNTVSDVVTSLDTTRRCDDCSDDSIVSPTLAERAVIKETGHMTAVKTVQLRFALKPG